jgi:hypothetical protein
MSGPSNEAFGAPGIAPTWSSSDKDFVTAALDGSRLWATIGHGIINEVFALVGDYAAQRRGGHWPQNYFPSGEPYGDGIQLDEAALPVLLAAKLAELREPELPGTRAMVRAAVGL